MRSRWTRVVLLAWVVAVLWPCSAAGFAGKLEHVTLVKTRKNWDLLAQFSHSGQGEPFGINAWSVTTDRGERLKTVHPRKPRPGPSEFESWMTDVEIPPGTLTLSVRAHDKTHGFEGSTPLVIDLSKVVGQGYEIVEEQKPLPYRRYHGEHVKRQMKLLGKFVPFVW
jgi:hypothetical protein